MKQQLSTEPYKGVRDFTPQQMRIQNYILGVMHHCVQSFGYLQYDASLLEEADLYRAKSGSELVNEQTYTFTDRGGREVTLRPEMTPTLARMIAADRRTLTMPSRWYSIPNCFRYERPQRGRLREFWQLNVDMFGSDSLVVDAEIISVAADLMRCYGATPETFCIKINNRKLMKQVLSVLCGLDEDREYKASKLIDKKNKLDEEEFNSQIREIVGEKSDLLLQFLNTSSIDALSAGLQEAIGVKELQTVLEILKALGVSNVLFDPTLMRGLDYYTGIVFEVFDTGRENIRALFGGGRYDKLVDIFGCESVTACGFGFSDVVIEKFLETYNLIPELPELRDYTVCSLDTDSVIYAMNIATKIRTVGKIVAVDFSDKKLGNKISLAESSGSRYVVCVGQNEVQNGTCVIKELKTREQKEVSLSELELFI